MPRRDLFEGMGGVSPFAYPGTGGYAVGAGLAEGVRAGLEEYKTARQRKKEEAMMRMMLGTATAEDEKLLKMAVPKRITKMGEAEWTEEKYRETLAEKGEERKRKEREAAEKREDAMWEFAVTLNTDPFTQEVNWEQVPTTIQKMKEARKAKPKPKPTAGERMEGLGFGKEITPTKTPPRVRKYTPKEFSKSKLIDALLKAAERGDKEAYKTLKKMRSLGMLK